MLNHIIGFSIRNKLLVALCTLALVLYGSYQFTRLPIDAVPDITNNQVQVITIAPSFGATDIERLLTFPVEQATANIPGLIESRSFSRFGLSLVTLVFGDDTDVYWARQQVAERLQQVQAQIPPGIGTPELGPVTTGLGEIYQYVVRPQKGYEHKYDPMQLRTIQDWMVRRQLLGVKGVAEVSSFGGRLKQYSVEVDPDRLLAYGLTIADVFRALEKNNQNTGGAYIEKLATAVFIRSEGLLNKLEDLEQIAVKYLTDGTPVFLRDVAGLRHGEATRYGALCYNDEGEVAGAVVMMLKGANSNEVIKQVKEKIATIQQTLPEGVVIEPFLDRTKMVNNAIGTVERNLLEGALIVICVLVLFLGNLRAGLLVASVIPLSMLFAVIMMNIFGVSGNLMSLGALDFGLVVDGAVIIVEAVMHRLHGSRSAVAVRQLNQQQMDAEVATAAGKMMNSAVFGQVIILIVYLPIFALEGIEGKMFKPMAQTVAFALIGAFLLSLTYVPMMSAWLLDKNIHAKQNFSGRLMARLENAYQKALGKMLRFGKWMIAAAVVLFMLAVLVLMNMGGEFIPELEEGDFAVDTRVLTGSSLNTTIERTQKAAGILKARFPEVEKVVTKIGSGEVPTDPMPMEASDMMVILKDKDQWTSAESFDELAGKMNAALTEVPGITVGFQYPVQMRFNELMTGARQDVVCKIFGDDLDTLARYAQQLGRLAQAVPGAADVYVEPVTGVPQILIQYNRAAIAQYRLTIADINNVVHAAFAGQVAGTVYEGERRFDLVVRLANEKKKDLRQVQNLLVPVDGGQQIPLYLLADVDLADGPVQIQREGAHRRIVVGFNVQGRDVAGIVNELQQQVKQNLKLPPGYTISYGGAFENLNAAKKRLGIAVPVALLLIFTLLYFAFGSVRQGLLIYTAIPLSAIGGVFFLALRGMPFSISAGVGFIALFGVSVLNGIVLIAELNRLRSQGMQNLKEVVLTGTRSRLRPVLMTACVASLGFLPMALSNGAGAEVQRPLATVVIGGLLTATLLTLFVLPALYMMTAAKPKTKQAATMILLLLMAGGGAKAQPAISAQAAVDSAWKNNLDLQGQRLHAQYLQALVQTGKTVPKTNFNAEVGQINSAFVDTRFTVGQTISFPRLYTAQKEAARAEWQNAVLTTAARKALLKQDVLRSYYHLLYLQQKTELLQRADTVYTQFLRRASLRLQKGESNVLEQAAAATLQGQVQQQLEQVQADQLIAQQQLQWLMQTQTPFLPIATVLADSFTLDTTVLAAHPYVLALAQEAEIAAAQTSVEKARLLPDLTLAYSNSSIRGVGADEKKYRSLQRFHALQFGVAIPIFAGAQKARVNSAVLNQEASAVRVAAAYQRFLQNYKTAFSQYRRAAAALRYFNEQGLANASLIIQTAEKQFAAGAINYLEWAQVMNQAWLLQNDYAEAQRRLNESIIEMRYFHNQ